jgi:hypothetical protein
MLSFYLTPLQQTLQNFTLYRISGLLFNSATCGPHNLIHKTTTSSFFYPSMAAWPQEHSVAAAEANRPAPLAPPPCRLVQLTPPPRANRPAPLAPPPRATRSTGTCRMLHRPHAAGSAGRDLTLRGPTRERELECRRGWTWTRLIGLVAATATLLQRRRITGARGCVRRKMWNENSRGVFFLMKWIQGLDE